MKRFDIWMEGYAATGQSSGAQRVGYGQGKNFDEAVKDYMANTPKHGIEENSRKRYRSDEHYKKRDSNWNIWACDLYDNHADAAKAFG